MRCNLVAAREAFERRKRAGVIALGLFALSPVPSAQLFEAAGLAKSTSLQSALVAPLVFSDRFIGTLAVYSTSADFYTDDHRRR